MVWPSVAGGCDSRFVSAFLEFILRESSQHADFDAFLAQGADEVEYVRVRACMEVLIADG